MNTLDVQRELSHELEADERLLWSGRPVQGLKFDWKDAVIIPFFLLFLSVPGSELVNHISSGGAIFGSIVHSLFILFVVWLLSRRYTGDSKLRARTFYGVTSKRILIVVNGRTRRTTTISLKSLADMTLSEHRNGSGSIRFVSNRPQGESLFESIWHGLSQQLAPHFHLGEHARQVYELVRKAQAEMQTEN